MHVWTKNLQVASALMAFQGLINIVPLDTEMDQDEDTLKDG